MTTAYALDVEDVPPHLIEPGDRGALALAPRVIEKTAVQAVAEVERTIELSRRLTDVLPGRHAPAARATATVTGRIVQLRLDVAIRYPSSIVGVTRAVRSHVRDELARLCDVEVRDVDIVVTSLRRPEKPPRVL